MGQAVFEFLIRNIILLVLISNSGTTWPAEVVVLFGVSQTVWCFHIAFQEGLDTLYIVVMRWCTKYVHFWFGCSFPLIMTFQNLLNKQILPILCQFYVISAEGKCVPLNDISEQTNTKLLLLYHYVKNLLCRPKLDTTITSDWTCLIVALWLLIKFLIIKKH